MNFALNLLRTSIQATTSDEYILRQQMANRFSPETIVAEVAARQAKVSDEARIHQVREYQARSRGINPSGKRTEHGRQR